MCQTTHFFLVSFPDPNNRSADCLQYLAQGGRVWGFDLGTLVPRLPPDKPGNEAMTRVTQIDKSFIPDVISVNFL